MKRDQSSNPTCSVDIFITVIHYFLLSNKIESHNSGPFMHFRRVIRKLFRAEWKTVFSSGWTMEILTRASQHCMIAQHH